MSTCDERITPMTAAAIVEPSVRITELNPFAAAVSEAGTACMMSVGIAAYAKPTPNPTAVATSTACQTSVISPTAST